MIQVITPAGDRHEAWGLSQEYMQAQTFDGPVRWIVTDDGQRPLNITFKRPGYNIEVHRLEPIKGNSQSRNLLHALNQVEGGGPVICWEDDDLYLPGHIESIVDALQTVELTGERVSRYYNVMTNRHRTLPSRHHASLASVGVRKDALTVLRTICTASKTGIDIKLWRSFKGSKRLLESMNVVGIKGLPGRTGIGVGHRKNFGTADTGDILRKWAGSYADNYTIFREEA